MTQRMIVDEMVGQRRPAQDTAGPDPAATRRRADRAAGCACSGGPERVNAAKDGGYGATRRHAQENRLGGESGRGLQDIGGREHVWGWRRSPGTAKRLGSTGDP